MAKNSRPTATNSDRSNAIVINLNMGLVFIIVSTIYSFTFFISCIREDYTKKRKKEFSRSYLITGSLRDHDDDGNKNPTNLHI